MIEANQMRFASFFIGGENNMTRKEIEKIKNEIPRFENGNP